MSVMRVSAGDWDELLDLQEVVREAAHGAGVPLGNVAALPLVLGDGRALSDTLRRRLRHLTVSQPAAAERRLELRGGVAPGDPASLAIELRLGMRRCALTLPLAGAHVLS
jgi:hypothetical protein